MPSILDSDPKLAERHDDLDNYDVDDFSDDPFAPVSPDPSSKKRKEPESGLGIDEEVSVQKRARVPNVKLDEERLLGPKGIPKLRARAHHLKIKGKGHEFSDAARMLSFYQLWLDDLFPKAKFLDALAMVEKAGHKKQVMVARNDLIQDGKPKDATDAEDDILGLERPEDSEGNLAVASSAQRARTPEQDDVPNDEDLYDATPRASRPIVPIRSIDPNDDDLEALIAEAEVQGGSRNSRPTGPEPDEDDLDALMAMAESEDGSQQAKLGKTAGQGNDNGFADDEAAMQEMEGLW